MEESQTIRLRMICDTIADAGYEPMIYSSVSYLNEQFDWKKLKGYKVWVAAYRETKPKLQVL